MKEFKVNMRLFRASTVRRVVLEVCLFIACAASVWLGFPSVLPKFVAPAALVALAIYTSIGLACYPSAKRSAQEFKIVLAEDLVFVSHSNSRHISYKDIQIDNVRKSNNQAVSVRLRTSTGQKIRIGNLEDMDKFHHELQQRIANANVT